jgi:hypothetical protein
MADGVFNIAKGAVAEKIRDGATVLLILLLKSNEAEATLRDRADVAAILANGSAESDATNYARKTGLTGTITVDNTNDRVDCDLPDQTWTALGGATNNAITKAVVAYQEAAADASRIPLTHHDFVITTDGSDVTLQVNASGFFRAS